jgi:hypothetical protein
MVKVVEEKLMAISILIQRVYNIVTVGVYFRR